MHKHHLPDEELEILKGKFSRVVRVNTPAGHLAFRAPSFAEENAFQKARFSDSKDVIPAMAWRNLMATIVVFPDAPTFAKIQQDWPALNLNQDVIRALQVLRGEVTEEEGK